MENTLENKSKFYTQYFGQQVFIETVDTEYAMTIVGVDNTTGTHVLDKGINLLCYYPINSGCLLLKPLTSITNEDAIETAKLMGLTEGDFRLELRPTDIHLQAEGQEFTLFYEDCSIYFNDLDSDLANSGIDYLAAYDFLRSKGYALPYMGLSVEELIRHGWIKLTA